MYSAENTLQQLKKITLITHCITWRFAIYSEVTSITSLDDTCEYILRCEPGHGLWSQSCWCSHLDSASNTCAALCKFFSLSLSFLVYNGMPTLPCGFQSTGHCKPSENESCTTAFSFCYFCCCCCYNPT